MTTTQVSRREFLRVTAVAGAGLTLAVSIQGCGPRGREGEPSGAEPVFLPNAFVRIAEDGSVTVPEVLRPYMGGLEKIPVKS